MARIINLLIIIFELIALFIERKSVSYKKLVFYTRLSNLLAFFSSVLIVIFGPKFIVELFRYTATSMLVMTFFVTVCVLVPATHDAKGLLFSGTGLYHHLFVPILSTLSYIFFEERVSIIWVWIPIVVTVSYGLLMLYLNHKRKLDGPYPFFMIHINGVKKTVVWMVVLTLVIGVISGALSFKSPKQTNARYVFVHGLSGWGSYDVVDEFFPYWGTWNGNIIRYLNDRGYESYSASVGGTKSAWDRACELYAQLTGTRVDYGIAHSKAAGHERFGEDYTGRALMDDFDSSKVALIGHSFGGATVRLFLEIIRNGSEEERAATTADDLSPFFKGGGGNNIFAVVALAAPTNGTTAYDLHDDTSFDENAVDIPEEYTEKAKLMSNASKPESDTTASWDSAAYDMHIDNAQAMNSRITTFDDVYYFAYPCNSTLEGENGEVISDSSITEGIFMKTSILMSNYTGTTRGGMTIDRTWQPNDGLVNVISAKAPFGAPSSNYSEGTKLIPGVYYIMPEKRGDHMSLQGGFTKKVEVKPFYMELVKMLQGLQ